MPILTASDTFSVGDSSPRIVESVDVLVVSAPVAPGGTGRLAHPIFGVYDYEIAPDEWTNVDADILYPPVWAHTKTLSGVASTRWAGYSKDVEVSERWTGAVAMKAGQMRMLVDFWMNPPATGEIVWSPNYANAHSYNVQIVALTSGGSSGVTLDYTMLQGDGFVKGPFEITYRIKSKVS